MTAATSGELLLNWLSYMREGSWPGFLAALAALQAGTEPEAPARVRSRLSELGHVEFFVEGSRRWRTFAPVLGGLRDPSLAILAGGRTARLVDCLTQSTSEAGCSVEVQPSAGPDRVIVMGTPGAIGAAADSAGLPFVADFAGALAAAAEPVSSAVGRAAPSAAPVNWSVRSFDLDNARWVDGLIPDTAYEYRPRYGQPQHYLRGPRRTLLRLDKRDAVYGAAWLNRTALLSYNAVDETLSAPSTAPMPERLARAAAGCSGVPAEYRGDRLVYCHVSPTIAGALMVAAGQRPLEPHWLAQERSRS